MSYLSNILFLSLVSLSLAAIGKDEKTFGWMGDIIFGNCDTSTCRYDRNRARDCCNSGRNTRSDISRQSNNQGMTTFCSGAAPM